MICKHLATPLLHIFRKPDHTGQHSNICRRLTHSWKYHIYGIAVTCAFMIFVWVYTIATKEPLAPATRTWTHSNTQTEEESLSAPVSKLPTYPNTYEVKTASQVVDRFLQRLNGDAAFRFSVESLRNQPYSAMVHQLGTTIKSNSRRLRAFENMKIKKDDPNYRRFHYGIRQNALYDPTDPAIEGLLTDMATKKIVNATSLSRGTTLKLILNFENGGKALFKPMRIRRDEIIPDCHFRFDYERHYAEIAAFHIDKILGFYMVPPVTGRVVNITADIRRFVDQDFSRTFYVNSGGQICFYGTCTYHCNKNHSACGTPDLIESSLKAYLPEGNKIRYFYYPYVRSSNPAMKQPWQLNDSFCKDHVLRMEEFKTKKAILDLADHTLFIFLLGDIDTHKLEYFDDFGLGSQLLVLDSGKGFCTPEVDELSLLTPIQQCCKVRRSTFLKLAKLYIGPEKLSEMVDSSMTNDPLYPVLTKDHLRALDRRLVFALQVIAECFQEGVSVNGVIVNDL